MKKRKLGNQGLTVTAMGLGCMGMSEFYVGGDEQESVATIHRAIELGMWVMARGEDIVPIPGTKRRRYLEENARAAEIELSTDDLKRLDKAAPRGVPSGTRYPEAMMGTVNR